MSLRRSDVVALLPPDDASATRRRRRIFKTFASVPLTRIEEPWLKPLLSCLERGPMSVSEVQGALDGRDINLSWVVVEFRLRALTRRSLLRTVPIEGTTRVLYALAGGVSARSVA